MDQLIHAFGIDVKLIIVQIINFVLLASLLSYFLYKPVLKVLEDRKEKIAQGIKDAEAAAAAKASADTEKQNILTEAHKEAEAVSLRAKTGAEEKAATIVSEAEAKAFSIKNLAEEAGESIKDQAHKEAEAEIAQVAILAAEKILKEKSS